MDNDRLLNEGELAEQLGSTVRFLQSKRMTGGGPEFIKVGDSVRYSQLAVGKWLKSRTFNTNKQAKESLSRGVGLNNY